MRDLYWRINFPKKKMDIVEHGNWSKGGKHRWEVCSQQLVSLTIAKFAMHYNYNKIDLMLLSNHGWIGGRRHGNPQRRICGNPGEAKLVLILSQCVIIVRLYDIMSKITLGWVPLNSHHCHEWLAMDFHSRQAKFAQTSWQHSHLIIKNLCDLTRFLVVAIEERA